MKESRTTRRILFKGLAALALMAVSHPVLASPTHVSLDTKSIGNQVRVKLKLSVHTAGFNINNQVIGPIYVPRDGKAVTRVFNLVGIVVTVIVVIIGVVMTVITFGAVAGIGEIFRRTLKKTV